MFVSLHVTFLHYSHRVILIYLNLFKLVIFFLFFICRRSHEMPCLIHCWSDWFVLARTWLCWTELVYAWWDCFALSKPHTSKTDSAPALWCRGGRILLWRLLPWLSGNTKEQRTESERNLFLCMCLMLSVLKINILWKTCDQFIV